MSTVTPVETQIAPYEQAVIGKPAPKDKDNNLVIQIHLNGKTQKATFLCDNIEHVGGHEGRKVHFVACDTCTVYFTNENVFKTDHVTLYKDEVHPLPVDKTVSNQETECWVIPGATAAPWSGRTPPRFVVP